MTKVALVKTGRPGTAWVSGLPHPLVERVMNALGWEVDWYHTTDQLGVPGLARRWSRA